EPEPGIARERGQHVVQERLRRRDGGAAVPGREVEADPDACFIRFPHDSLHGQNSSAAVASSAPVYSAMPTTTPATPVSARPARSAGPATPPDATSGGGADRKG